MQFYGMLHAGKSQYVTRNGGSNGVRVAAVIDNDDAQGYIETTLNEHGRWTVSILPPPGHGGSRVEIARGDLTTNTVERGE